MERKEKKILIIVSGVFLALLAIILFITMQSRDNMINNGGRYKGTDPNLGDDAPVCTSWVRDASIIKVASLSDVDCQIYGSVTPNDSTGESNFATSYCMTSQTDDCSALGDNIDTCYYVDRYTRTCNISTDAELMCYQKTYNGSAQLIAECNNCTLTSVTSDSGSTTASDTNVYAVLTGTYAITAQANEGHRFSNNQVIRYCEAMIRNTQSCCYLNGTEYVYGETADTNCVSQHDTEAICLARNNLSKVDHIEGNKTIAIAADIGTVLGGYQAYDENNNLVNVDWTISSGTGATLGCDGTNPTCSVTYAHQGAGSCGANEKQVVLTATSKDGTAVNLTVNVYHYCRWTESTGLWEKDETQATRDDRKITTGCYAYEGLYQENGKYYYTSRYERCCGCGGGDTPATYCYIKRGNGTDNEYCYNTAAICEGQGFSEKINSSTCNETAQCYQKPDGTYVTGKYSGQPGYTPVGATCPSTPAEACYVKRGNGEDNTYCYGSASTCSGFTEVVSGITNASDCKENIQCYLRLGDNTYVMGKYDGQAGYEPYGNTCPNSNCYINKTGAENQYVIASENPGEGWEEYNDVCEEAPACYLRRSDNKYVTGKYAGRDEYELYGDICPTPVPTTDLDVATIIYIGMGVLALAGAGFVIYANKKKINK